MMMYPFVSGQLRIINIVTFIHLFLFEIYRSAGIWNGWTIIQAGCWCLLLYTIQILTIHYTILNTFLKESKTLQEYSVLYVQLLRFVLYLLN